ncbi:hypothetical protein ACCO45_012304 [Purpureocillium lilacinum]|uniref:Uncharacterized protein n=1 Tax=Purpureocillium lilacinum TaxID=33203 RepID=A0ACC4DA36_PURLI
MSISSSSHPDDTSLSHIDGDEQTNLSTTSDWSVWNLDLLDILTGPGAPENDNVDTTTTVTDAYDRGTQSCGWDNNTGSNGSTEIQAEILACVRQILSRMNSADTTTPTVKGGRPCKVIKPQRRAGRKRKSRSIASTGAEKVHTVKIKKLFLGGRGEVDEYSWEDGIWAPTKGSNELDGLVPNGLLSMHEDLSIDLHINGGNFHPITVRWRDDIDSMEGWDAWEERGLRIGYEAIVSMLENPAAGAEIGE